MRRASILQLLMCFMMCSVLCTTLGRAISFHSVVYYIAAGAALAVAHVVRTTVSYKKVRAAISCMLLLAFVVFSRYWPDDSKEVVSTNTHWWVDTLRVTLQAIGWIGATWALLCLLYEVIKAKFSSKSNHTDEKEG